MPILRVPPPTPAAERLVRYIVGFGVGIGVGLAPFLGQMDIPLFSPLLELYPVSLRPTLIPLSAFLMGVVAVAVEFYGWAKPSRASHRAAFKRTLQFTLIALVLLCIGYFFLVVTVPVPAVDGSIAFVVGASRKSSCPCPSELSDGDCIKWLSFDPSAVAGCWGDFGVRLSQLLLSLSYLLVTGGFGALVGLMLLRKNTPALPGARGGA